MASLRVLAFDHEGRPIAFDTWHDDLQLYLLSDIKDGVSLFDHVSGVIPAPPAIADGATHSQWLSRDATARLGIRNHLPVAECTHFGQHRTAQALYDAVVVRYSSPATTALGRLLLPYLIPELSAFATVADLVTHLRTSDAPYRATVPAGFLPTNQPPMFITLYFIVSRLPNSLCSVRDHFFSLDPTSLTVDLLEQHLLAAETSAVAIGAARGTPRPPFFEGCSPSPLSPSFASSAAEDVSVTEDVGATSTPAKRRSSKGKGGQGGGGGTAGGGGGSRSGGGGSGGAVVEAVEVVAAVAMVAAVGALVAAVEAAEVVAAVEAVGLVVAGLDLGVEALVVVSDSSSSVGARPSRPSSSVSAMYALTFSAEGDCYRCVPPDPGIAAATLNASASGTPPGTASAEALHTFMLDSGASRCFFRDNTTLSPLPAPVSVRLADPSGGPVVARSSTVLLCPAVSASPPALACPALPSLRRGAAARRSSLLLISPDNFSPVDSPHGLRLQLRERFGTDLPVLRLHFDRGGEFSSDLLRDFCLGEGILQSFTLPNSPQQNGIAERRIGLVMELNLWPRVSLAETSPTLHWTGKVGDASVFRVWGSHAFVRDTSADKLSARAIPCCLFPYRSASPPPPPLFLAPGPPAVDPLPPQGPAPSGVSRVDPLLGTVPVQVAVGSAGGAGSEGAGSRGAEPGGAEPEGVEPGGAESEGAESGGAANASPGASGAGGAGDTGAGGAAVPAGAGGTGGAAATIPGGARTSGSGAAGTSGVGYAGARNPTEPGASGAGGAGAGVGGLDAGGAGLEGAGAVDCCAKHASPLLAPSPYTKQSGGLTERREPASRPVLPVRTACRAPRSRPPPVPCTHAMALRPSSVPLRVPLPAPPESSLLAVPEPASDRARAASPTALKIRNCTTA
ncbi:unnamed protein product [Closterium sp. NIES-54]